MTRIILILFFCVSVVNLFAQADKTATPFTVQINQAEYQRLDFSDSTDYREAT